MAQGDVRIGISGWRYEPWRGTFYPRGLAHARELEYASRRLRTIEINGSFYSLQTPQSYARWRDDTPGDFVFAVKGGRFITHMRRLLTPRAPLGNFFASGIAELRTKLGPFLWQLPPNFPFDAERIEAFLDMLPKDTDAATALARHHDRKLKWRARCVYKPAQLLRHAMEVRHPSFVDPAFIGLLRKYNVAFVIADTARKWVEYEDVSADFVYVRLHGAQALYQSRYTEAELVRFASHISCWAGGAEPDDARRIAPRRAARTTARDVYCYFDNTDKIEAPGNAIRLAELVCERQPFGTSTLRLAM
jgi:uncharacterized protein YecE (DUF72 family)